MSDAAGVLLKHTRDPIATLDNEGRCTAVNPALEALLDFPIAPGTPLANLVEEPDRIHSLLGGKEPSVFAHLLRTDGRVVPVELTLAGSYCFIREQESRIDGRLAEAAAVTAVGSLATGLAHEINNPLAVVLANVEEAGHVTVDLERLGAESMKNELFELRTILEEAHVAAQRVQFIVRDLRAFASADDRRGRVDVTAVIESCCNIALADIRHRARLVKDLKSTAHVLGSESKLAQLFFNILINAADSMPEGDVESNTLLVSARQHERTIVIEISDTGDGIEEENQTRIFEPFFTTSSRRPGMGLVISQSIVSSHGGELTILPQKERGTIVRISLPALEPEVSEDSPRSGAEDIHRRILVVDDDLLVLRSLTRMLARDFQVAAAKNGREALDLVRAGGTFDAMLCDLMMPELSGIELHQALFEIDPELAKRTVFLTGGALTSHAQTFLETVGQPHLQKPVDVKTMREVLLEMSKTPHEGRTTGKWLV